MPRSLVGLGPETLFNNKYSKSIVFRLRSSAKQSQLKYFEQSIPPPPHFLLSKMGLFQHYKHPFPLKWIISSGIFHRRHKTKCRRLTFCQDLTLWLVSAMYCRSLAGICCATLPGSLSRGPDKGKGWQEASTRHHEPWGTAGTCGKRICQE